MDSRAASDMRRRDRASKAKLMRVVRSFARFSPPARLTQKGQLAVYLFFSLLLLKKRKTKIQKNFSSGLVKIKIGSLGRKFSRRKKDTFGRKKISRADRKAGTEWFKPHKRTCLSNTFRKPLSTFSSPELRSFWPAPRIVSSGGGQDNAQAQ